MTDEGWGPFTPICITKQGDTLTAHPGHCGWHGDSCLMPTHRARVIVGWHGPKCGGALILNGRRDRVSCESKRCRLREKPISVRGPFPTHGELRKALKVKKSHVGASLTLAEQRQGAEWFHSDIVQVSPRG